MDRYISQQMLAAGVEELRKLLPGTSGYSEAFIVGSIYEAMRALERPPERVRKVLRTEKQPDDIVI